MSILTLEAKLERQESSTPWGFRMQGGKDFSSPITIARVVQGSLAAKCGLQQGDIILKIGNKASETLKHKDAQDAIISYGNKLDLLLQRGGTQNSQTYDKFSTPTIGSYQSPAAPAPGAGTQSYNKAPQPFGSVPSKPPAPYSAAPQIDIVTQQTQNINLNQSNYSKYADADNNPGAPSHQSRSFKFLQDTLDSGQAPPAALRPTVDLRRSPSPNAGVNKQFNSPSGLYSSANIQTQQSLAKKPEKTEGDGPAPAPPAPAPVRAPPAPKPGVWTPGQGSGGPTAPAAKPFSPNVAPAPAPPMNRGGAPPKPTGVGAVRGKLGDAVVKTGDSGRVPICASCGSPIRGPFVLAMGKSWCPDHFICANPRCGEKLVDIGFVEEGGFLYCEKDYELYFAPHCAKCEAAIVGECVNALNKQYHPTCFLCHKCKQPIGGTQFHLEDGNPYCENDWRQLYQTMCSSCNFPIEPGDKWVEALGNNYHSECFNCSTCQVNLEGQAFYAKSGKPYCKKHAR